MSTAREYDDKHTEFAGALVKAETQLAVLFDLPGLGETWVPKSLLHADSISDVDAAGSAIIRTWFCDKNDLL